MAVSILSHEVSDLCLGKPALSSLSASATVGDALSALKRSGDLFLSVWSCDRLHHCNSPRPDKVDFEECKCVGKVPGLVRHLEPHANLLDAIDVILGGAQNLVIPLHNPFTRKKLHIQIRRQLHPPQQPRVLLAGSGRHNPLPPQLHWRLLANPKPHHRVPRHHRL
ncbi:hypothetical protein OIU84_002437 [Salix udensis]|uniref:Uncharacterized protein n=1 Tax=Salix udensis TaxID=889485 RepID=A0AAD6P5C5_9ROSI|nr:hypothetical protein OIU84_002437 [Salix udensis]